MVMGPATKSHGRFRTYDASIAFFEGLERDPQLMPLTFPVLSEMIIKASTPLSA